MRQGPLAALLCLLSAAAGACEACRVGYLQAMEAAPRASALNPSAKVVAHELHVAASKLSPAGTPTRVLTVNGQSPGPVLRFREGDVARVTVFNDLADETTSMHWHGVLVPNLEDGVPDVTTTAIAPGASRTFEFLVRQDGTYWYHSHTGHQKQAGVHGAIVIEPREPAAASADHDEAIVLADWTDEDPAEVQRTLLRGSDWYALRRGAAQSLWGAWRSGHLGEYLGRERALVPPMDLSDVAFNAFLMNGRRELGLPGKPGETVRARLVNASAATYFYIDAATGPLRLLAADGQAVRPVEQRHLLIAPGETYDVLLTVPPAGRAELRATAQDGSGSVSAWLGAGADLAATPPPRQDPHAMNDYLASILDQNDPEPGAAEPVRPLAPYARLRAAKPHPVAAAHRDLTLRLTGDMLRYEWTFDGIRPEDAEGIRLAKDETLRVRLVNDTMMHHPIHFHGHFFRLVDDSDPDPATSPLKHTVDVPPMSTRTIEFTADEGAGDWLLHCHLLYHHTTGMMRVVRVAGEGGAEPPHPPAMHRMSGPAAWGQVEVTSASHRGLVDLRDRDDDWTLAWEGGMRHGEGREIEADYRRNLSTRLGLLAGYRLDNTPGGRDGPLVGADLRLPYFIDLRLSHQSGGETRLAVAKSLQLTDRLSLGLELRDGRKTGTDTAADLRCTLTKALSLSAGYSSAHGAGAGLVLRF